MVMLLCVFMFGCMLGCFVWCVLTSVRLGTTSIRGVRDVDVGVDVLLCVCRKCCDIGRCDCKDCNVLGFFFLGGYYLKNVVDMKNAVGTRWIVYKRTRGW